jgi:hypothetical protein
LLPDLPIVFRRLETKSTPTHIVHFHHPAHLDANQVQTVLP